MTDPNDIENPVLRVLTKWIGWVIALVIFLAVGAIMCAPMVAAAVWSDSWVWLILGILGSVAIFILVLVIVSEIEDNY